MPLTSSPLPVYQTPSDGSNTPLQIPWYPWDPGQNEWCWAACAQMLAAFYQNTLTQQCVFVSQMSSGQDVCDDPGDFNNALDISRITDLFPLFNKTGPYVDHALSFEQVQGEIQAGRPVEVGYQWGNGGAHVAIVAGAAENDSGQYLYVNDPDPQYACGWCLFSDVQSAYGNGTWQWTWMPIQ